MKIIERIDISSSFEVLSKIDERDQKTIPNFYRKYEFNYAFKTIYDYDIFCQQRYYEMPYHHDNGHMKKDYITRQM